MIVMLGAAFFLVLVACVGFVVRWITTPKTLYVDPVTGDDVTAKRGDHGRPFRTIHAAMSASKNHDTVFCAPGVYTIDRPVVVGQRRHLILHGVVSLRE